MEKENNEPPAYTEQPLPSNNFTPAQTYPGGPVQVPPQSYPGGPTQPPLYPPYTLNPPPQPAVTTGTSCVVINSTTQFRPQVPVGRDPTFVKCPSCHADVLTTVTTAPTGRTHVVALILCLVG